MPTKCFWRARKAAVSVLFAATAVPMIGAIGLAVDYGIWNQTNSQLSVAANVAALTAVKMAANAQLAGDPSAQTEAQTAGNQWFLAEVGANGRIGTTNFVLNTSYPKVTVNMGSTVTAEVEYQGVVPSIFGGVFYNIVQYPVYGRANSEITSAPYLNVEIMLDNSGSMDIGATNNDIQALQENTPCNIAESGQPAPGAFYNGSTSNLAGQSYAAYSTTGYTGPIQTPQIAPAALGIGTFPSNGNSTGPSCKGILPKQSDGTYPKAGPPCAFACHSDTGSGKAAGTGNDFFAVARASIGTSNPISLRFDLVKYATTDVVTNMQSDNLPSLNNLQVGLFTFDNTLHRVYPTASCGSGPSCEAGGDWSTALNLIGAPPTGPNQADTGIQASNDGNGPGDTDFHDTMTSLSNLMTASGDGATSATPRKVLFLVTDGMSDYTGGGGATGGRAYSPVSPADCALFKNLGFTVYVVFTPYYPVMNPFYVNNIKTYAEPLVGSKLYNAMQSCASSPSDFISASSRQELTDALNSFLKAALNSPARFTF